MSTLISLSGGVVVPASDGTPEPGTLLIADVRDSSAGWMETACWWQCAPWCPVVAFGSAPMPVALTRLKEFEGFRPIRVAGYVHPERLGAVAWDRVYSTYPVTREDLLSQLELRRSVELAWRVKAAIGRGGATSSARKWLNRDGWPSPYWWEGMLALVEQGSSLLVGQWPRQAPGNVRLARELGLNWPVKPRSTTWRGLLELVLARADVVRRATRERQREAARHRR
jgi:hypothetical protein